tara:strand:- start:159 stop:1223 length:1065 start_codon:yes stop_codon:yes gene_type:complete
MMKMSEEIQFDDMVERVKAALAGGTDAGSQMFPTETADEIIQIVYERNFMRSLFAAMPMSTRTVKVPKLNTSINFHRQTLGQTAAGTASDESTHGTAEVDLTLITMIANIPIGNYLIAYGVEGLLTVLRDDIASRLAFNEESLLINGDKQSTLANNINGEYDATNNPTGINATAGSEQNDYLLELNGLRKLAGTSVSVSGTFALSHLRSAISALGVYADNRDELSLIVPRNLEVQLLGFTELQTVDKYGAGATILSGELGRIYGIRVFATGVIPTNLDWDGTYDSSGQTDKTVALLVHNRSPMIGNPTDADRRFNMGFLDEPTKDRFVLIPRQDIAFAVRYTDALCLLTGINTV